MEESVIGIESEKLYIEIKQEGDESPYPPLILADIRVIYKPHIEWINPRTRQTYTFGGYEVIGESSKLGAKTFEVTLNAKSVHTLTIEYKATLGIDEKESFHPIYRFDYLLYPASY